ncbi:MAG TPA: SUF system NifU family Fe-S cluster assembly protein [Gammaproteobacteria bacterium]|nr:SUF system NifU family Fe-S cluster assembly protein [Gammaproteobacteria bacterium]
MSDLRSLYQEMIVDHGKNPRNFGALDHATHAKDGHNPLCGDKVTLYINEKDGILEALCFEGKGCAISMASASLMTEALAGTTLDEVNSLFNQFHQLVTEKNHAAELETGLGKLAAFKNIAEFPARVKCATLAWHTLRAALDNDKKQVSTE